MQLFLFLLLLFLRAHPAPATTSDDCERFAPLGWAKPHRQRLCAVHPTALALGPARCATAVKEQRIPSLSSSIDLTISLCSNASSDAPARCAAAASTTRALRAPEYRVELCRGAPEEAPVGPVTCFEHDPLVALDTRLNLCQGARGPTPVECFAAFPLPRFGVDAAVRMCRDDQRHTAQCVGHSAMAILSDTAVLTLCAHATSEAPALCFEALQKNIPTVEQEQRIQLCAHATSLAPATCVQETLQTHVWRRMLLPPAQAGPLLVSLCAGSSLSTEAAAPAQCLGQAPPSLSLHDKVALCQGSQSPAPAICARDLPTTTTHNVTIVLCQGTTHDEEAAAKVACFTHAPYGMPALDKAILCKEAFGKDPATCAKAAARQIRTAADGWDAIVHLCQHAATDAPAGCFASAPQSLSLDGRVTLCIAAETSQGPPQCAAQAPRHLSKDVVVRLCAHAPNAGPVQCLRALLASSLGSSLSDTEQLQLCRGAQDDTPAQCAREAPLSFPAILRASLCTNITTGTLPARCAHLLPSCYAASPHTVLSMCRGVAALTPAYCLLATQGAHGCTRPVPDAELKACQDTVSQPAALRLLEPTMLSSVAQGRPFDVLLAVDDQYGQFRQWDNTTVVRVRLTTDDRRDVVWSRASITRQGQVLFVGLRVARPGAFWLHLGLGGGDREEAAPLASFPIDVAPTVDAQQQQECLVLFDWSLEVAPDEDMHVVPWPHSLVLAARGCLDSATFPGVAVAWAHDGALWLTYPPNLWRLATGFQVPTRDMPFHARLGMAREETRRRVLRQAYYRQSLLWHPDRWTGFPHAWRTQAETAFALVGEAYRGLLLGVSGGGRGGDGGGKE